MTRAEFIKIVENHTYTPEDVDAIITAVDAYSSASNDGKPLVSGSLPLVQQTIQSRIKHFENLVGHSYPANQLKEALSSINELIPPEMW
jgi:hypothetical protein